LFSCGEVVLLQGEDQPVGGACGEVGSSGDHTAPFHPYHLQWHDIVSLSWGERTLKYRQLWYGMCCQHQL